MTPSVPRAVPDEILADTVAHPGRAHVGLVHALDDALEALELRAELAPLGRLLLVHRELLGPSLHRRLIEAQGGGDLAVDQLWREGHAVRRLLDQGCCLVARA